MNIFNIRTGNNEFRDKNIAIVDYLFWSFVILFTNPGGIIEALNLFYIFGKINFRDVIFVILTILYLIIPKTYSIVDHSFIAIKRYLLIFLIYFYLFYVVFIPRINNVENYSLIFSIIKTRYTLYHIAMFFYIYVFFRRRWDIFLKIFLLSSIIVLILFLQARVTGINILPISIMNRNFVNIDRNLMVSEGLMPLLIPLGIAVIVLRFKSPYRYVVIAGFVLMSAAYLYALWRRNIIAVFAYFLLAVLIDSFIKQKMSRLAINSLKAAAFLAVMTVAFYFISPKYTKAAQVALLETVSVVKESKTTSGQSDVRLGLNRPFINNLFYKNPVWGTGFDNRWRIRQGDEQGYEAADYPLLAALAMFGLIGILLFGPVYLHIIKTIISDLKYIRGHPGKKNNAMQLLSITFILFFLYHLMQYFNYYIFISVTDDFINYFFLSLYYSSRAGYYYSEYTAQKMIPNAA